MTLTIGLSVLIGLFLGLLGGGGSILTVPMLVYLLGIEPKKAIVTSLVVVGVSSLIAIVHHARRQHVCWKSGVLFGLSGMLGAYGGGRIAGLLGDDILMALFGFVTLITGLAMLRGRKTTTRPSVQPPQGKVRACPAKIPYLCILFDGSLVGLLTGLIGVGGGFLIVPALVLLVGLPMPAAVGTSLLIIVMNAGAGLAGYSSHVDLDYHLTVIVTGATAVGAVAGGLLSTRVSATALRHLFGLFVIIVAGYVLRRALTGELLTYVESLITRHTEFVWGATTLCGVLLLYQLGVWIHAQSRK